MKISISRNELFEQLPNDVRLQFMGNPAIPEMFTFNVKKFAIDLRGDNQKMVSEYPEVRTLLTATEWLMFCILVENPSGISYATLGHSIKSSGHSNSVAVHAKNIRNKLKKANSPYELETIRGNRISEGSYRLNYTSK